MFRDKFYAIIIIIIGTLILKDSLESYSSVLSEKCTKKVYKNFLPVDLFEKFF